MREKITEIIKSNLRTSFFSPLILLTLVTACFLSGSCSQNQNYDAINSKKVGSVRTTISDTSQAAKMLQAVIRNSHAISVYHKGFKPNATPPSYPPKWKPKEVLDVNESTIKTCYQVQHWINEKEVKKVSKADITGYGTVFYFWEGIPAGQTLHYINIPFDMIKRVSLEESFLSKYSIIRIYYSTLSENNSMSDKEKCFKIWLYKGKEGSIDKYNCLASLSLLCHNLKQ